MSPLVAARALSIVGHPALLMPVAIALAAFAADAPARLLSLAVGSAVAVTVVVGVYSVWQVRAGRWAHVDASRPVERRQLTRFLAALMGAIAVLLWAAGQASTVVCAPLFAALPVLAAHALRRRLKVSLHAAYAVFAAALLWPHALGASLLGLLALGVAWSRLELQRHTRAEVLLGLLFGALSGAALQWLLAQGPA